MYNLLQTQIIENPLTTEQVETLVKQHGYYVTYEEDKRPANVFNTFTVFVKTHPLASFTETVYVVPAVDPNALV